MSLLPKILASVQSRYAHEPPLSPESVHAIERRRSHSQDFLNALHRSSNFIIAELKRKSPSQGEFASLDYEGTLASYVAGGASGISVLTNSEFFGGSIEDLVFVKSQVPSSVFVLMKDFVLYEVQIDLGLRAGADMVLLIARALGPERTLELYKYIQMKGGLALIEVHEQSELKLFESIEGRFQGLLGVNNRDLDTLQTDLSVSKKMASELPKGLLVISESGIENEPEVAELSRAGYRGFLVGGSLLRTGLQRPHSLRAKLASLVLPRISEVHRKICGLTNIDDAQLAQDEGAFALGFVIHPLSPRVVDQQQVHEILARLAPMKNPPLHVVVFTETSQVDIQPWMASPAVDVLQIHCEFQPLSILKYKSYAVDKLIWIGFSAAEVGSLDELEALLRDQPWIDKVILDGDRVGGSGKVFDWSQWSGIRKSPFRHRIVLAGGLTADNQALLLEITGAQFVDVSSGIENQARKKDPQRLKDFLNPPNKRTGRFGPFGGQYVAETLMAPLLQLKDEFAKLADDREFKADFLALLKNFVGRPTALYLAENLTRQCGGARIYLKREDLAHTGAHKINNSLGQALLAKRLGKKRVVAETGAGQHGVATAAACANLGLSCVVYMGEKDMRRQAPNVQRMKLLGAEVRSVSSGAGTLKDAVSEALRDWVTSYSDTHYILGSALGPDPFPTIVRDFQKVIGEEARSQILEAEGKLPDEVIACVGGGSNAIGVFTAFRDDLTVRLVGIEAGGQGPEAGHHAARFQGGRIGVFQGTETYVLQTPEGQILETQSVSAGLDYAAVGPEHADLYCTRRAYYLSVRDAEAVRALKCLATQEGIIAALESSHALAYALQKAPQLSASSVLLVNLSGRGDKDLGILESYEKELHGIC